MRYNSYKSLIDYRNRFYWGNRDFVVISKECSNERGTDVNSIREARKVIRFLVMWWGQIYKELLNDCSDLILKFIEMKKKYAGDTYFPYFRKAFKWVGTLESNTDFRIIHCQKI